MRKKSFSFSFSSVDYYFNATFEDVSKITKGTQLVFITDENIYKAHRKRFGKHQAIVISAGEEHKVQATVDSIIAQLISFKADRNTWLVGVGGGVITDITGYTASVYMRGIRFGFIPTSILAMVDASVGGKNGIDVGVYKNLVGTISQPRFILFDMSVLKSLPAEQWSNGFAEVIKHACIKDRAMFSLLAKYRLSDIRKDAVMLQKLLQRNVLIKTRVVQADEFEQGERRLLNFGHTIGHAIENEHGLLHGHAIAIGMVLACRISEQHLGFSDTSSVVDVLKQYNLPVELNFDKERMFEVLAMDKKRTGNEMKFILLEKIGHARVVPIALDRLYKLINTL